MTDQMWAEVQLNIPSLLPLQPPPQTQEQVLNYLAALHNYLADDRQKVARAINIVNYYRYISGTTTQLSQQKATASKTFRINETTLLAQIDTEEYSGTPTWEPITSGNVYWSQYSKNPTGFANDNEDSTIGISGSNFFIEPTGDSFTMFYNGREIIKSAQETLSLSSLSTEGMHYITYNEDGELELDAGSSEEDYFENYIFVAVVYYDGSNVQFMIDERHGMMPWQYHYREHLDSGTTRVSGLGLSGLSVDGDGNTDAHAEFDAATGVILDEDVKHTLATMNGNWDIMYLDSGAWVFESTGANSPVKLATGVPQYNDVTTPDSETLASVTLNQYFLMHVFATNIVTDGTGGAVNGHVAILGQNEYISKLAAREAANEEINSLVTSSLPLPEFIPVGTVIFQRKGSNAYNAAVVSTDAGDDYVSWLEAKLTPGASPTSHAALTERDAIEQHPTSAIYMDDPSPSSLEDVFWWDAVNSWWELCNDAPAYLGDDLYVEGVITSGGTAVSLDGHTHTESDITDLDHTDADAIHGDVAGEIYALTQVAAGTSDMVIIEDASDSWNKKRVALSGIVGLGATDSDAIHSSVAAEVDALANVTPTASDKILLEDQSDSWNKKEATVSQLLALGATDSDAVHDNVAGEIAAVGGKSSPVGGDKFLIEDSENSWAKKALSFTNLMGGLKLAPILYLGENETAAGSDSWRLLLTVDARYKQCLIEVVFAGRYRYDWQWSGVVEFRSEEGQSPSYYVTYTRNNPVGSAWDDSNKDYGEISIRELPSGDFEIWLHGVDTHGNIAVRAVQGLPHYAANLVTDFEGSLTTTAPTAGTEIFNTSTDTPDVLIDANAGAIEMGGTPIGGGSSALATTDTVVTNSTAAFDTGWTAILDLTSITNDFVMLYWLINDGGSGADHWRFRITVDGTEVYDSDAAGIDIEDEGGGSGNYIGVGPGAITPLTLPIYASDSLKIEVTKLAGSGTCNYTYYYHEMDFA